MARTPHLYPDHSLPMRLQGAETALNLLEVVRECPISARDKVFDIGCGPPKLASSLWSSGAGGTEFGRKAGTVFAMDNLLPGCAGEAEGTRGWGRAAASVDDCDAVSEAMRSAKRQDARCRVFLEGDFARWVPPEAARSAFDVVFSSASYNRIVGPPDRYPTRCTGRAFFEKALQLLRPDGHFLLRVPGHRDFFPAVSRLTADAMSKVGRAEYSPSVLSDPLERYIDMQSGYEYVPGVHEIREQIRDACVEKDGVKVSLHERLVVRGVRYVAMPADDLAHICMAHAKRHLTLTPKEMRCFEEAVLAICGDVAQLARLNLTVIPGPARRGLHALVVFISNYFVFQCRDSSHAYSSPRLCASRCSLNPLIVSRTVSRLVREEAPLVPKGVNTCTWAADMPEGNQGSDDSAQKVRRVLGPLLSEVGERRLVYATLAQSERGEAADTYTLTPGFGVKRWLEDYKRQQDSKTPLKTFVSTPPFRTDSALSHIWLYTDEFKRVAAHMLECTARRKDIEYDTMVMWLALPDWLRDSENHESIIQSGFVPPSSLSGDELLTLEVFVLPAERSASSVRHAPDGADVPSVLPRGAFQYLLKEWLSGPSAGSGVELLRYLCWQATIHVPHMMMISYTEAEVDVAEGRRSAQRSSISVLTVDPGTRLGLGDETCGPGQESHLSFNDAMTVLSTLRAFTVFSARTEANEEGRSQGQETARQAVAHEIANVAASMRNSWLTPWDGKNLERENALLGAILEGAEVEDSERETLAYLKRLFSGSRLHVILSGDLYKLGFDFLLIWLSEKPEQHISALRSADGAVSLSELMLICRRFAIRDMLMVAALASSSGASLGRQMPLEALLTRLLFTEAFENLDYEMCVPEESDLPSIRLRDEAGKWCPDERVQWLCRAFLCMCREDMEHADPRKPVRYEVRVGPGSTIEIEEVCSKLPEKTQLGQAWAEALRSALPRKLSDLSWATHLRVKNKVLISESDSEFVPYRDALQVATEAIEAGANRLRAAAISDSLKASAATRGKGVVRYCLENVDPEVEVTYPECPDSHELDFRRVCQFRYGA